MKKNNEVGMPAAIIDVVQIVAQRRASTTARVMKQTQANIAGLIGNDPSLRNFSSILTNIE